MKIVINGDFGGFGLSGAARARYAGIKGIDVKSLHNYEIDRSDPALVQVVEELGKAACAEHSDLKIVDIPDGVAWEIVEYDGLEYVAEQHRKWH